jgi:hypothetical protein
MHFDLRVPHPRCRRRLFVVIGPSTITGMEVGRGGFGLWRRACRLAASMFTNAAVWGNPCSSNALSRTADIAVNRRRQPSSGHPLLHVLTLSGTPVLSSSRGPQEHFTSPIDLNCIHASSSRPHTFAVGGGDECVRVYDARTAARPAPGGAASPDARSGGDEHRVFAMADTPIARLTPARLRPRGARRRVYCKHVTGIQFSGAGELLATYNDDDIFLFAPEGYLAGSAPGGGGGSSRRVCGSAAGGSSSRSKGSRGSRGQQQQQRQQQQGRDEAEEAGPAAAAGAESAVRRRPRSGEWVHLPWFLVLWPLAG